MCVPYFEQWTNKANEIENNDYVDKRSDMYPLSNTMEQHNLQNPGDIMGDVKQEQYGSTNSLDNAERKR